jgi:hypothetical protein
VPVGRYGGHELATDDTRGIGRGCLFCCRSTMDLAARQAGQFAWTQDGRLRLFGAGPGGWVSAMAVVGGGCWLFCGSGVRTVSVSAEAPPAAVVQVCALQISVSQSDLLRLATTHSATGSNWTRASSRLTAGHLCLPSLLFFFFFFSILGLGLRCLLYPSVQHTSRHG